MSRRTHEHLSWESPPAGWSDQTRPWFQAPDAKSSLEGPALRLWFELLAPGETIRTLADRKLVGPTKDLPGLSFVNLDTTETLEVGGRPAIRLRFLFTKPQKPLVRAAERLIVQTAIWVDAACDPSSSALVIVAIATVDAVLDTEARVTKLLASVRFEAPPSSRAPQLYRESWDPPPPGSSRR